MLSESAKKIITQCCVDYSSSSQDKEAMVYSSAGVILHEFVLCMIMLQNYAPIAAGSCDGLPQLAEILDLLDRYNKLVGNWEEEERKDLEWDIYKGKVEPLRKMYSYPIFHRHFSFFLFYLVFYMLLC